jgi:hypothetical protein
VSGVLLGLVTAASAVAAVLLHRHGHDIGDDFALYLRQARSLFDGDVADVVSDYRFSVLSSTGAFSPYAYPWGWPLLPVAAGPAVGAAHRRRAVALPGRRARRRPPWRHR